MSSARALPTLVNLAVWPAEGYVLVLFAKKGEETLAATLVIIKDVVAVDGGGGMEYRGALMRRYCASPAFRKVLKETDLLKQLEA